MKIKVAYRRNLKMSEGKLAAQVAHAVKNLGKTPLDADIVVLKASDTKFEEFIKEAESNGKFYIQKDKGLTQVKPNTQTAVAWIVKDEIITLTWEEIQKPWMIEEDALFEYEGEQYKFLIDAYRYLVEEYGVEDVHEGSHRFEQMFRNGMYEKV